LIMSVLLSDLIQTDAPLPAGMGAIRISGITSDSRAVRPGFLFAALPGTVADGANFIDAAFASGAVAAFALRGSYPGTKPVVISENPRRLLALTASRFFGSQPETVVAVTGTNGKTSVAVFVRQIWAAMGFSAASLGTIGVVGPNGTIPLAHTTPDPVALHEILASLRSDQVRHLAIEASSHGLLQHRLDGLLLTAGGFTNLTRDHLDYHGTEEGYIQAKLRLFTELLPQGSAAVINVDVAHAGRFSDAATKRGLQLISVGRQGQSITLHDVARHGFEQHLRISTATRAYMVTLPLAGEFQVANALVAAGLVLGAGGDEAQTFHALESLKGAVGRLDFAGKKPSGGSVFVDYAHTPDALESALTALRPYATGKLVVVFGCGGDRDPGKRPLMGAVAYRLAQRIFVTDDNPRNEDAALIRKAILVGVPGATEIADRYEAIATAIEYLGPNDVLLVAGKGHEQGQIVGKTVVPFNDHDAVTAALAKISSNA
jgi:UDP-N-acetylmuramoyl-L-alanyl-D-glutamate--2,6-diaminopimelate ligase